MNKKVHMVLLKKKHYMFILIILPITLLLKMRTEIQYLDLESGVLI
jgi:hypothetical protein